MSRFSRRQVPPSRNVSTCGDGTCDKCPKNARVPCGLNETNHTGYHMHLVSPPKAVFNPDGTPNGFVVSHVWGTAEKWDEARGPREKRSS